MKKSKKALQELEYLLKEKQNNGTIKTLQEEIAFITGAIAMIHELTKHENKNQNDLECYPPKYFLAMMRNESINKYKYQGE